MEVIGAWLKGIFIYLIWVTLMEHLLPTEKYKRYIRIFTGMLLLLCFIKPIGMLFSIDTNVNQIFSAFYRKAEIQEMEDTLKMIDNDTQEALEQEYKEYIRQHIEELLEEKDYYLQDLELSETKEGELQMSLVISREKSKEKGKIKIETIGKEQEVVELPIENEIKKSIIRFYNLKEDNINIKEV